MSSLKVKLILKYLLTLLFIGYYFSITLFYHSHVINGKEIVHSHFYWNSDRANGEPVKHSHTQDEFLALQIISQFITTIVTGFLFLKMIRVLLSLFLIPLNELRYKAVFLHSYLLRGPPSGLLLA